MLRLIQRIQRTSRGIELALSRLEPSSQHCTLQITLDPVASFFTEENAS